MEIQITEMEERNLQRLIEYREASIPENERDLLLTACYKVLCELGQRARMQREQTVIGDGEVGSDEVGSAALPESEARLFEDGNERNDISELIN